ncbi:hotdog domain-containing protein [Streptomyces sp. NPDC001970]
MVLAVGVAEAAQPLMEPDQFQSTLEFKVNFLRPVRPGRLLGHGRVVDRDGDLAHLAADVTTTDGTRVATATATARVIKLADARSAA